MFSLLFIFILTSQASSVDFKLLNEEYTMEVKSINAVPWPPRSGLRTAFQIRTNVTTNIQRMKMSIDLHMRVGINDWDQIIYEKFDLCNGIIHCPVIQGEQLIAFEYTVPQNCPVGNRWKGVVTFTNEADEELNSVQLEYFKIK